MNQRIIIHVLQKLADLPPATYERVAEVLMSEFLIPQPSIAATIKALVPSKPRVSIPAPKKPRGRPATGPSQGPSKAGAVRALLTSEGPKTTAEIAQRVGVVATHIHPLLASIGAKPMGTITDADGDDRKVYGIPGSMVRDESSPVV